ncbi:rhomboid family intramembrane serine protease [Streptomyces finlayi]|uniref:Rhomboid family intramembrane serine protease n=1 Tax=Streptomyces finlayi TaxID=67296 RepID=A0A7G7BRK9_9ACTN|nr:rhomboid family intramembrane serine protease [Streptomyces finlayi]QNE77974.1 rhomboid family intramembrane serine protease [Streptomyces finlayi]
MEAAATRCYRHPSYETYVSCTRCDRYICPDCMREAAVGHHCVECVKEGQRSVRRARRVFGGAASMATTPVVTYALMGLNVLAYVAEVAVPSLVDRSAVLGAALVDAQGEHYYYEGAVFPGYELIGIADGEWYRLLTGAFLHLPPDASFGVMHLVFNMLSLWNLGRAVEVQLGRARYLALYLLSAVGGSVLVYAVAPDTVTVGASGAVFGLGAAYHIISRRLGRDMRAVNRLLTGLLLWLVVSAWFTSWQGHLGGLLTGALVTWFLAYAPARFKTTPAQIGGGLILLCLFAVVVASKTATLTGAGGA